MPSQPLESWLLGLGLAVLLIASPATAQSPKDVSAVLFETLCVANDAQLEAVAKAARAQGLTPVAPLPPAPEGMTRIVAFERGAGTARQVVVVSKGVTAVSNRSAVKAPARACAVTGLSPDWDVRGYARAWVGQPPLVDAEGTALYEYLQQPDGVVVLAEDDLTGLFAGLNAGQLRTLVAAERGTARALSWIVIEAPDPPAAPAQPAASASASVPFAPCEWRPSGKKGSATKLYCPEGGETRAARGGKGLTENTPAEASGGDIKAMLRLAYFYFAGPAAVRAPDLGLAWSRRAADAGSAQGLFNVGLAYERGAGVGADPAEAARWYRKAADLGHQQAMINLAALLVNGVAGPKDPVAAVGWVRRAADAGSVDALFNMGKLSESGLGVTQSPAEAFRWYRLAADQKDMQAMYKIGLMYADGVGTAQSTSEAVTWLVKGVTSVHALTMVINNMDFTLGGQKALDGYLAKAAGGDANAALRAGLYYSDKGGRGYNPREAMRLLQVAADKGYSLAMSRMGVMFAEGAGVERSDAEAIRWLRAAGRDPKDDVFRVTRTVPEGPEA